MIFDRGGAIGRFSPDPLSETEGGMMKQVSTLAGLLLLFFTGATVAVQKRSLDQHIEQAVGPEVVDCGTFSTIHSGVAMPPREASTATSKPDSMYESLTCARDAAKQKKAFRLVQRGPSLDSEIATGVIGRADGSVMWFVYDSAPCGGPGCDSRFTTEPCELSSVVVIHRTDGNHSFGRIR